jgi:uncharacterized membrane protein YvbJ
MTDREATIEALDRAINRNDREAVYQLVQLLNRQTEQELREKDRFTNIILFACACELAACLLLVLFA